MMVISRQVASSTRRQQHLKNVLRWSSSSRLEEESLTLYQYAICPFCHKTKALLSYAGIGHKVVEVNPLNKQELKLLEDQTHKKVPIATVVTTSADGGTERQQINGSNEIIEMLLEHPQVQQSLTSRWEGSDADMTMDKFRSSKAVERWWYRYADDDLAALLYPNVCRTLAHSFQAFRYVQHVHNFSTVQKLAIQTLGSFAMYFAASKIKSKRNIKDEQKALQTTLDIFEKEALQNGKYSFSSQTSLPDMGDLTVYGVLRSVKGLPAHDFALKESRDNTVLLDWYTRMEKEVEGRPLK